MTETILTVHERGYTVYFLLRPMMPEHVRACYWYKCRKSGIIGGDY